MNDSIPTKVCTKCQAEKPLTEFWKVKQNKDGLLYHCKSCVSIRNKRYRLVNKDKINAQKKAHRAANKSRCDITQKRLKELLDYNPATGKFTRRFAAGGQKVGSVAGGMGLAGYVFIAVDGKQYRSSRLAFMWMEGYFPEHEVDHINRVRNDDRWSNLREVSRKCNSRNCSVSIKNKSTVTGVYWDKDRDMWSVQIRHGDKTHGVGRFGNLRDAAQARWDAEVKYGYPNCNTTSSAYLYLHNGMGNRQ